MVVCEGVTVIEHKDEKVLPPAIDHEQMLPPVPSRFDEEPDVTDGGLAFAIAKGSLFIVLMVLDF